MPRIPSSPLPSVGLSPGPSVAFSGEAVTNQAATTAARQVQGFGQAMQQAGQDGARIYTNVLEQANAMRVMEAENRVRQRALDLAYDKEAGFRNLKGLQAIERPNGEDLSTEYGRKLDEEISSITASLGNDAQRRMFQDRATNLSMGFQEQLKTYQLNEYRGYSKSVIDGQLKLSAQEATMNWHDPQAVNRSLETARQALYAKAQTDGLSANEIEAAMRETDSQIHSTVIMSALSAGNSTYAADYFRQNRQGMTAQEILKIEGQVNTAFDTNFAGRLVEDAAKKMRGDFVPSDMDRLTNIVMGMESNGRRFGPNGKLLESPAGAKGEMQVMDGTNTDPGFGVTPARDNSPEERARVGRDYLAAMVERYGNVPMALAAYNAGPGSVDDAVKAANEAGTPGKWMNFLPKPEETVPYVQRGVREFTAGQGAKPIPTKADFTANAIAPLGENARPELVAKAKELAEKQYGAMVEERKQRNEQALQAAQRELLANGGDYNALSVDTRAMLSASDPENVEKARKFAKSMVTEVTTNTAEYARAVAEPGALARMNDVDFQQYVVENFSESDRKQIAQLRADTISGKSGPNSLPKVKDIVEMRWNSLNPDADKKDRDEALNKDIYRVTQMAAEKQQQLGRTLNDVELADLTDRYYESSVFRPGFFFGNQQVQVADVTYEDIPEATRLSIEKALTELRGGAAPSPDAVLRVYIKKISQQGQPGGGV